MQIGDAENWPRSIKSEYRTVIESTEKADYVRRPKRPGRDGWP
jgi:hypothetical protein